MIWVANSKGETIYRIDENEFHAERKLNNWIKENGLEIVYEEISTMGDGKTVYVEEA